MTISIFNLFSIGIGPSSSHTVGPMKAAREFVIQLAAEKRLQNTQRVTIELFGSLAFTGKGHGTDNAILLGLEGQAPDTVNPDTIKPRARDIIEEHKINLAAERVIPFSYDQDVIYNFKDLLPEHTNGMRFIAYDAVNQIISSRIFYSIGGGFIIEENHASLTPDYQVPYPFSTAKELLQQCEKNKLTIKEVMLANESSMRSETEVRERLLKISQVMKECIEKGCHSPGTLPGGLNVKRRAPELLQKFYKIKAGRNHMNYRIVWDG